MNGDTPIKRKTFLEMTEIEQIAFTEEIRKRRMTIVNAYQEIKKAKYEKQLTKLQAKLDKECEMFEKCNAKIEKLLTELESRATKIKILKVQLEIEDK